MGIFIFLTIILFLKKASLKKQDIQIIAKGTIEDWSEGCCVSLVVVVGTELYSANLGDSHIVLSRNISKPEAILLSTAHKASDSSEKERITNLGGTVMRGRVFGDLSISRALGDLSYKQPKQQVNYISNEAHISHVSLTQNNNFIIIASDGVWDTVSPKEAVSLLYENEVCTFVFIFLVIYLFYFKRIYLRIN